MKHTRNVTIARADTFGTIGSWISDNSTTLIASIGSLLGGMGLGALIKGQVSNS